MCCSIHESIETALVIDRYLSIIMFYNEAGSGQGKIYNAEGTENDRDELLVYEI